MIEVSRCGLFLDRCQCAGSASNIPRSVVEIAARHKEAVSRATRSTVRAPAVTVRMAREGAAEAEVVGGPGPGRWVQVAEGLAQSQSHDEVGDRSGVGQQVGV